MAITTAKEIQGLKHNGKSKIATRYGLDGNTSRFYLWVYPSGKKIFYYKSKNGEWIRLNELTQAYGLANAIICKNSSTLKSSLCFACSKK